MLPFEFLYYIGHKIKKHRDLKNQKRLPVGVISIGNITTGGTGKTPLTIALAEEAVRRGFRPCILTRGYKGRLKGPILVSESVSESDAGDEPLLMLRRLKGIPVVKGKDRYISGIFALGNIEPPPDLFILDDGFQHWRLRRDKDILLIDSKDPFGNGRLLPVGFLREPLREIKRADIIVVTKVTEGSETGGLLNEIREYNPDAPVFFSSHRPLYVRITSGGEEFEPEWLLGQAVFAFCGIGEPDSFRSTLAGSGANITGFKAYRDHYRFKEGDLEYIKKQAISTNAQWIITTEKDIMRMGGLRLPGNTLTLGIGFSADEVFYDEVFKGQCPRP